jgi:hypothetical protein
MKETKKTINRNKGQTKRQKRVCKFCDKDFYALTDKGTQSTAKICEKCWKTEVKRGKHGNRRTNKNSHILSPATLKALKRSLR